MIHHVFANKSNIGDWLSAIGIQKLLAPAQVREHLCDEPFVNDTLQELSKLTEADQVVIGGGGLFMDYFTPLWRGLEEINLRAPFTIWGVGYCDLKLEPSQPPIELLRRVVSKARRCFVRDDITRKLLDLPSVSQPMGCPSLCAIEKPLAPAFGLLHVDNYTTAGVAAYEAMDAAAASLARQTGRQLRRTNNRISAAPDALAKCLTAYEKSDLVISSALHGCIVALAMGRKVLAISGDWKIEGFMELIGLRDWVLSIDQLDGIPVSLEALAEQPDVSQNLNRLRNANRQIASIVKEHA